MRLFVAIPLSPEIRQQLAEIRKPEDGVRWLDLQKCHITLKFLGETAKEQLPELRTNLRKVRCSPFTLSLNGLGYFGSRSNPKVLWAGIDKSESLQLLQRQVEEICTSLGFEKEDRAFKPHITVARLNGVSGKTIKGLIEEQQSEISGQWKVKQFVLCQSILDSEGARYKRLQVFPLTANP